MKTVFHRGLQPYFFLVLLALIWSVMIYIQLSKGNKPDSTTSSNHSQLSFDEKNDFVDEINDGLYVDNKFGFTFSYPEKVFRYQYLNGDNVVWLNEEWIGEGMDPTSSSKSAVRLGLLIRETNPPGGNDADEKSYKQQYVIRFNEFLNIPNGEKVDWGAQKISEESFEEYKRITFLYESTLDNDTGCGSYYGAWWLKDNQPVINLELLAGDKVTLKNNKHIFDNIVDSFSFIK